jgi:hypothetical protein
MNWPIAIMVGVALVTFFVLKRRSLVCVPLRPGSFTIAPAYAIRSYWIFRGRVNLDKMSY